MPEPINASEYEVVWRPDWPAYACPDSQDKSHSMSPLGDSYFCQNCFATCRNEEAHAWWNWAVSIAARESIVRMSTEGDFAHMKQMCN